MSVGGSAAPPPRGKQTTVVFITEDRTGVTFKATLAETADGNSGAVQRREVNFDLKEDDEESMENRAVFLSFRMRLYNVSGEVYTNHKGEAFDVLREAVRHFAKRDGSQPDLTVYKEVMLELGRRAPMQAMTMSELVHAAEKGKLTLTFKLSDGGGSTKKFKIEYDLNNIHMVVYKPGGGILTVDEDVHGGVSGYVSAYEDGYIAESHSADGGEECHDLALQESLNAEIKRWWPRSDINRARAVADDGCLCAWSVRQYLECTLRLFTGEFQFYGDDGGAEERTFPLVAAATGNASRAAGGRDGKIPEGDQQQGRRQGTGAARVEEDGENEKKIESDEQSDAEDNTQAVAEQPARGVAGVREESLVEIYKEVMEKAKGAPYVSQLAPHKNQMGMFTLHICEVQEQMASGLPSDDVDKWQDKKDFVATLQQSMHITGTSAVVQRRDRAVAGDKKRFTLVKMKVTAAPNKTAIKQLQERQLQLLERTVGDIVAWRGRRLRLYVWLGTQAPTDAAMFEINSKHTFAQLAQKMLDRGIYNWIFRGNFQIDPLKAVMSKKRVTGAMYVMVLVSEDYGRMARWEAEDVEVKIKLLSLRKTYLVQGQGEECQWVCPQDDVLLERDSYYIKVTPLNTGITMEQMVETQKKMKIYDAGQGQLSNISLGLDNRRKKYARYVGKGSDIVSVVDFYSEMAGVNGYPNSPRVEMVSIIRWDAQYRLGTDICPKCCEVGHNGDNCNQMMVCSDCFKMGDKEKLICGGRNCRWPERSTVEERRRFEILDSNALRRTALRYIEERANLVRAGELMGGMAVRMPCSQVVMAQVGGEQKKRVVAGPTIKETYEVAERLFAESDQAETAKAMSKGYYRAVVTGTTGTRLYNETTDSLKEQVISGTMTPSAAGKLQQGAKKMLADVISSGKVSDQTWLSAVEDMCDTTDFHRLAGTPQKNFGQSSGLTPAVGNISLAAQAGRVMGQMVLENREERSARRRLRASSSGSQSDSDSTSSTSTSTSSTSDPDSQEEVDLDEEVKDVRVAGRKSKRKKKSKKSRKRKKRRRARKEKRKLKKRRRKEMRAKRKEQKEQGGRGRVPYGAAPSKAAPLGGSMGS
ncbi:MAG: hypothetical protein CBC34_015785 [Hyphomicrobiaceae bacterium TMED74]|nr:hypothetical protein [Filomicrobium sp.]RPG38596.1 MAG: hypothetical protein CBC34_015785 [Hyphomicrobiaceae bacterium TMED74]